MGNNNCKPCNGGERVKDVLYRVFACFGRKRKIDELVQLTILNEDTLFRKVAGGKRLTKKQLDEFYEKRDSIIDEFDENVIEVEIYSYGHSTPSEYSASSDFYSDQSVSCSPDRTPNPPLYDDPVQQNLYEEWCMKMYKHDLDLKSVSDIEELEEYKFMACDQREVDITSSQDPDNVQVSLADQSQITFSATTNIKQTPAHEGHVSRETFDTDIGLKLEDTECGVGNLETAYQQASDSTPSTKTPRRKLLGRITTGLRTRKQDSLRTKQARLIKTA